MNVAGVTGPNARHAPTGGMNPALRDLEGTWRRSSRVMEKLKGQRSLRVRSLFVTSARVPRSSGVASCSPTIASPPLCPQQGQQAHRGISAGIRVRSRFVTPEVSLNGGLAIRFQLHGGNNSNGRSGRGSACCRQHVAGARPKEPGVRTAAANESRIGNLPLANTYACSFSRPDPKPPRWRAGGLAASSCAIWKLAPCGSAQLDGSRNSMGLTQ